MDKILEDLFSLQDIEYKNFNAKLIPTVDKDLIIGVRTPDLRNYAKKLFKEDEKRSFKFLNSLPHKYYEENNLHGFLIEQIKDFDLAMEYTENFIPFIDNWATCDSFCLKVFKKYVNETYEKILLWIKSDKTYVVRYGIGLLLSNYLDENFKEEHLKIVSKIRSEEYYINMMIAWYFATALAKKWDSTIFFIENKKLDDWTHNKAIQKAIESRRITEEEKSYLRSLKVKIVK
ncbi:DNA alkylation repair protein [uncultured Parvimonas sp.]|uniref:DNA alkylation repair protein n=1 Tax=uncultured Parvimonas sp. TaxID=747372 RepID=UPI0028893C87|nr:DNA alkylation repair protein [uncultured Parvimonas sp.]